MQSNYGYDISSGEEEGGPVSQTAAANPNDQHPQITAHHSNHSSDGVGNPLFLAIARVSPLGRDLCKTIGVPPFTGEMSEGQRGRLQDDQAKNATDKSFAKVSWEGGRERVVRNLLPSPCFAVVARLIGAGIPCERRYACSRPLTLKRRGRVQHPQNHSPSFKSHKSQFRRLAGISAAIVAQPKSVPRIPRPDNGE